MKETLREKRMVIVGGSRGIGLEMSKHYVHLVKDLITISRSPSIYGRWIQCDVTQIDQIEKAAKIIGEDAIDFLLYLGGTWENNAFTSSYSFAKSSLTETQDVINVNLVGPILFVQALLPNLLKAVGPRVVFMGSMSALDNTASKEVANSASKYGLRGAAQALELSLRDTKVQFTVVNPANVATMEIEEDIRSGSIHEQVPIPLADLASVLDLILQMSPYSNIREINMTQTS